MQIMNPSLRFLLLSAICCAWAFVQQANATAYSIAFQTQESPNLVGQINCQDGDECSTEFEVSYKEQKISIEMSVRAQPGNLNIWFKAGGHELWVGDNRELHIPIAEGRLAKAEVIISFPGDRAKSRSDSRVQHPVLVSPGPPLCKLVIFAFAETSR